MTNRSEFRYIVIGGGSAGCLIARRLAEQQPDPVALVEAGPASTDVRTIVPNYYPKLFGSSLDWGFATEPQAQLGNRRIAWPRGKVLGGSGAINALIYLQAAQADFERWGWDWASEKLLESLGHPSIAREPLASPHPWTRQFINACSQTGLEESPRLEQSRAGLCGIFSLMQNAGRRLHTGQTLHTLSNLSVLTRQNVQSISLSRGRADSVIIRDSQNRVRSLTASGEIVLCGGAVGSPMLLIRSGIGPAAELESVGLTCQHELAGVGRNLQDHLVYPVIFETDAAQGLPRRHSRESRRNYREHGTGPLSSNIAEATALFGQGNSCQSDFQIHFTPTHYLKYPRTPSGDCHLTLAVTDLHPRSRGAIRPTRVANGEWQARIDPQYLSHPEDVSRMLSAIAWARELAEQSSFRTWIRRELLPGAKRQNQRSLTRSLSTYAQSIYHPVGTCRMSSPVDSSSDSCVVDEQFRVRGLAGLRIADASVLPELPSANTNAVTLLLATRAADCILGAG